ncbi:MAG: hypothetical protein QM708_11810 [Propioniciclava sp.]|uniref:hypothetical protein n=1 Tax=Propioniciclava sp. TaxID=2038686 RepID=UPI0039E2CB75
MTGTDAAQQKRPVLPFPADQAWFWEERWQERERKVEEFLTAGEVTTFEDAEDFLAYLDDMAQQPVPSDHQP